MAQFVYTIDPQPLLASPDILPLVKAFAKAAAASGSAGTTGLTNMTDDQLTGYLKIAAGVLGTSNIKITRWVGEDDKLFHALGLDVNLDIKPPTGTPVSGTIHFLVKLTKVGQAVTITAPAGAKMIDVSQLMSGMMGGMSGGFGGSSSGAPALPTMPATPAQ